MEKPWGYAIMRNMKTKRQLDRYEGWTHHNIESTKRDRGVPLIIFGVVVLACIGLVV